MFGSDARSARASVAERVLVAAACALEPPIFSLGMLSRQLVEHGEDRGGADAGADQQHRRLRAVEDEGAARGGDVELVADREPRV